MGNQNDIQRSSMRRTTNVEPVRDRSDQRQTIDLDEIVEQWVRHMWNRTKVKSLSHYKLDDLLININWKRVLFTQTNAHFYGSPPVRLPRSQILFRTNFNNKTTNEHSYLFKTERFTRSTFKFTYTHSLSKTHESHVILRLPEEIAEIGGGIKREQSVGFGQDTTKEYDMRWSVNSQISVAPRTRTYAELNIDEEEFHGDFSVLVRFSGRVTATVATRQSPNTYLKFMEGDIVQIIREAIENNPRLTGFEILEEDSPLVQFTMRGKCLFRYGIEQHIILNQETLDPTPSSFRARNSIPLAPFDYRPFKPHFPSSNINNDSPIHLQIVDDEQL